MLAAEQAQQRAGGARTAAVRHRFISRSSPDEQAPPLARLLRGGGGRGGSARLKLYLSMLWLSRNEDAPLYTYPAHQWALLMGLDDPERSGARRIQEAIRWLDREGFVLQERQQGAPSHIRLLSDTGDGRPYRAPGLAMRKATKQEKAANLYVQLAAGFWTKGWVAHLSGAAIAMYLVLLHEQMGEENKSVWIAPRMGQERFDLSDETRRKGLKELVDQNLAAVRKRPLHQGLFNEAYRTRNVYDLTPRGFDLHEYGHGPGF
ncbi:hypothetical protein [Streptomyces sp. LN500]|uniref:hypothetical protein n=1 Tax=Streptomyces sp. LN500 TaxID=3112978 RepID=UPI003718C762